MRAFTHNSRLKGSASATRLSFFCSKLTTGYRWRLPGKPATSHRQARWRVEQTAQCSLSGYFEPFTVVSSEVRL